MSLPIKIALGCVAGATALALILIAHTTALTMLAFGFVGVSLYGIAVVLYVIEVFRDLRKHHVLD